MKVTLAASAITITPIVVLGAVGTGRVVTTTLGVLSVQKVNTENKSSDEVSKFFVVIT